MQGTEPPMDLGSGEEPHYHVHIGETGGHAHVHRHEDGTEHSHMHVHQGDPDDDLRPRRKQVKDLREGDLVMLYGTVVEITGVPSPGASPHGTRRPPLIPGWMYVPMEWAGVRCAPPEEALSWVTMVLDGDELPPPDQVSRNCALAASVTYPAADGEDETGYLVTDGTLPRELEGRHCKWCGEYVVLPPVQLPQFPGPYVAEFQHVKTGLVHCSFSWTNGNLVGLAEETAQACFAPGCLSNDEHEAQQEQESRERGQD